LTALLDLYDLAHFFDNSGKHKIGFPPARRIIGRSSSFSLLKITPADRDDESVRTHPCNKAARSGPPKLVCWEPVKYGGHRWITRPDVRSLCTRPPSPGRWR